VKTLLPILLTLIFCQGVAGQVYIERPPDNPTGVISVEGNDGTGVYCADQFETDFGVGGRVLLEARFYGFGEEVIENMSAFNVYIFEDAAGLPAGTPQTGNAVIALPNIIDEITVDTSDGVVITVDLLELIGWEPWDPGTYWICAFPTVNMPTPIGQGAPGRWNWYGSLMPDPAPVVEPVLIDPQDLFGLGATSWSNVSGLLGESFPAFAWELDTDVLIGYDDHNLLELVKIYPNPTTDLLYVDISPGIALENAILTDVLGRNTGIKWQNGHFNTSNLTTGVYILRIETSAGPVRRRVIKK